MGNASGITSGGWMARDCAMLPIYFLLGRHGKGGLRFGESRFEGSSNDKFRVEQFCHDDSPRQGARRSWKWEDFEYRCLVITPARCVGAKRDGADDELLVHKRNRLAFKLNEQFAERVKLNKSQRENIERLGYGG